MTLGWALLIIVVLFLLFKSQGLRKVALVITGLLILVGLLVFAWVQYDSSERSRKREIAKKLIRLQEVEIVDPRMSFSSYDGGPQKLFGRIRNSSRHGLSEIEIQLTFRDCPAKGDCETVGEQTETLYLNVPAGQSRDFEEYLGGPRLVPRGKLDWSYSIKAVVAAQE